MSETRKEKEEKEKEVKETRRERGGSMQGREAEGTRRQGG